MKLTSETKDVLARMGADFPECCGYRFTKEDELCKCQENCQNSILKTGIVTGQVYKPHWMCPECGHAVNAE